MASLDPQLEICVQYPRRFAGGTGRLSYDGQLSSTGPFGGRRSRLLALLQRGSLARAVDDIPCFDVRPVGVSNWSHAINQAVPRALMARDRLRENGGDNLTVVLPDPTPPKVTRFFEILGFRCLHTNSNVEARFVHLEPKKGVRSLVRKWVSPHMPAIRSATSDLRREMPRKVFIDRRRGRHLLNGEAVRTELHRRGYTTVYPEDLSLEAQLALFQNADDIVAIHGAGLASLLYRTADDGAFRLVEILSPGHMSLFFRNMVLPLPVDYRAIRGTPDAKMCGDAYRIERPPNAYKTKYAMAPFSLNLEALDIALDTERFDDVIGRGLPLEDLLGNSQ